VIKKILALITFFSTQYLYAQHNDAAAVKQVVIHLFDAMQKGDTNMMRSLFYPAARLQTALINSKTRQTTLLTENIDSFFIQVAQSVTPGNKIEERIIDYDVKTDEPMASVWANYEFYLNDKFSHKGVDAFQLFKSAGGWKIIQICDTRKRK